jgi:hypothetical protein
MLDRLGDRNGIVLTGCFWYWSEPISYELDPMLYIDGVEMVDTLAKRSRFASCKLVVRGGRKRCRDDGDGVVICAIVDHNLVGEKALTASGSKRS